jgi:hypothetical protein
VGNEFIDSALIEELKAEKSTTAGAVAAGLVKLAALAPLDPESTLVKARKLLELVLQAACAAGGISTGDKELDRLRADLYKSRRMPAIIDRHCRVILAFGNLAAHEEPEVDASNRDLSSTEVEIVARSVEVVCRWFLQSILPLAASVVSYRILHGTDVTPAMLESALAIDAAVYPPSFRADLETCLAWRDHNPEIYTAIVEASTQRLVGYINAMPLTEECFRTLESDSSNDARIPLEAIRRYELPDFYKLHVCSFAVDPAHQGTSAFRLLYGALVSKLLKLAGDEMFFTEVLAYALTAQGEKLARYTGMKRVRVARDGFGIYKLTLLPPALRVTSLGAKNLMGYYQAKYEEFKDLLA